MTPQFLDEGYLDALQTPAEGMAFACWEALASQVCTSTGLKEQQALTNPPAFAHEHAEPREFFSRSVLESAIRATGCTGPLDLDFVELHALLQVPVCLKLENAGPHVRMVLEAASTRLHRLLERRPELTHPNIRFRWGPQPANHRDGALYAAAMGGLLLTPSRMDAIADHPCVRAALDRMQPSPTGVFVANVVAQLLGAGVAFTRGAAALIRAGLPSPVGPEDLAAAAGLAGRAATLQTPVYEDAVLLLREMQRSVMKTGAPLAWSDTPAAELLEQTDFAWASARSLHPVTMVVYQMFLAAAKWDFDRRPDVTDFPGPPAREIVQVVNDCLVPDHQMPLESLSALQLLKLTALCTSAPENGTVGNYMHSVKASTALELTKNSCDTMLAWVLSHEGAGRLKLADFDGLKERLVEALGAERVNVMRSQLLHDLMKSRIDDMTSAPAPVISAAPPRRARAL